jgi:uncharacterized membrane protein
MIDTEWFYIKFEDFLLYPIKSIALAVAVFIITILIKSAIFSLSKYKRFDGSLLVASINTLLSGTGLFMLFFETIHFTDDLLTFIAAIFGAIYLLELIFTLLLKGKNSFIDGLIGSLLGNTILFMAIILGITFSSYPIF